jgi:hypothetical protein
LCFGVEDRDESEAGKGNDEGWRGRKKYMRKIEVRIAAMRGNCRRA